jgi:hypothetical protein
MVLLLVGVRNTMANLLSSLEDDGEDDEKKFEKHSTERERERERERDGIFHCRSRKYLSSLFGSLENGKKMMKEIQLQKRDRETQKENSYVCW